MQERQIDLSLISKRGIVCVLILILLGSGSVSFLSASESKSYDDSNNLEFTFLFDDPQLSSFNDSDELFTEVYIANTSTNGIPGQAKLPVKTISILLPPHSEVSNISSKITLEKIELNHPIFINEESSEKNKFGKWFEDDTDSDNDSLKPSNSLQVVGVEKARGYQLLFLNLYPCRYNSSDDSLSFTNQISFTIETHQREQDHSLYRNLDCDESYIAGIVENPSMISYYHQLIDTNTESIKTENSYSYIIITSDDLEPHFNSLIKYKEQYLSARTVNFSFINSNFYGRDMQERIRECIKYAYSEWGTEYVLIGGDVGIVPYRGLWGEAIDHEGILLQDNNIPSDLYYACLDGSWDADNDSIYGEDGLHSVEDESDLFAEVYVGRAPVENKAEIGTFINKVITFETSIKPEKVLLHQSGVNTNNDPDSTVIPEQCAQWIPASYEVDKLYQVNETISTSKWMERFSDNNLVVHHTGNGLFDQYYVSWPTQIFTSYQSLSMLKNNFYPIHTSVACNSGGFDHEDSIAETLLLNPYGGASACLFNSRRGFTSSSNAHKYSGEMIEEEFRNMFYLHIEHIGKINQFAKESFAVDAMVDPAYRWCYYTFNLLGDPEMPVFEKREQYLNSNHFYVDDDFSTNTIGWNLTHFDTIQKGIDAASDWDFVHVNAGMYNEYLTIKKTIRLIGEDKSSTIIDGGKGRGPIRTSANRVTIQGFTIKNDALSPDGCRIFIKNSNYVTISDCIISDNDVGIYAAESTNLFIVDCTFLRNEKSLYIPMKIGTVYLSNNEFVFSNQDHYGILGEASGEYILHNNTFSSKAEFADFTCAVYVHGTAELVGNKIFDCSIGVWLTSAEGIIEHNVFSGNNHIGFYADSSSVTLLYNHFENNGNNWISYLQPFEPGGIILNGEGGLSCLIENNIIDSNRGYGVLLKGYFGLENKIKNNDFIDNSIHAFIRNSYCSWSNNFWQKNRAFPKIIYGVLETSYFFNLPFVNIDFVPRSSRLQI